MTQKHKALEALKTVMRPLNDDQRLSLMTLLLDQDDCDLCAGPESYWKEAFGDAWCETRNYLCGPESWDCPGFPKSCG